MKISRRQLVLAAPLVAVLPRVAWASGARVVLGRFSTGYAIDAEHRPRAFNVELAAEAIDGKVIAPGATFSFNDAVGERTAAFGFTKAVVLRDAMIAEGIGGGTCQVASTLHAAALLSGLDVSKRAPHSRPSAYIRMGFDATVVYPSIDLKLRNPRAESVTVNARSATGVLEVWIDASGADRPSVTVTSEIVEWLPFPRVVERDRSVTDDDVHVKAFGIPGYRVRRMREIREPGGAVRRDGRIDLYPPTSEIVRVAPGFDVPRLTERRDDVGLEHAAARPRRIADAGAVRPVLVQLRPSTKVTIDNGR